MLRHPAIRILLAAILGLWSPMCCCQAAALLRDVTGSSHGGCGRPLGMTTVGTSDCCGCACSRSMSCEQAAAASSDGGQPCDSAPVSPDDGAPDHADDHEGAPCPSCPACTATAAGTGLAVQWACPAPVPPLDVAATADLVRRMECEATQPFGATLLRAGIEPAHLRANRAAQRWHCALIV